jgi:putative peptidoglycan lipid II flippase
MKDLVRPAVVVTALAIVGQVIGFATQVVIAGAFGARPDMDAFLAASTLPQYVVSVLLNALVVVFVPVFLEYEVGASDDEAWRVASTLIILSSVLLAVLALVGLVYARPLLRLTTPGLSPASLALATRLARITWPSIVASGVSGLLTGIYHAKSRFGWPSAVPIVAALFNLALVLALVRPWGISGVAVASVVGLTVQTVLLLWLLVGNDRLRLSFDWRHPGVARLSSRLWPLVLSGLLIRCTPVVDRYVASNLPPGSIAHLGYAFKMVSLMTLFLSTGIATVVFPRMAFNTASHDLAALRATMSTGLRMMWLGVAPFTTIGIALALPLIATTLERGAFQPHDTRAVATLSQIYFLTLFGSCLGSITGRAFYALKDTRTVAAMGVVEAVAYVVYTPWLAARFGADGVAAAYAIYFTLSIVWQFPVLRVRMGRTGGRRVISAFLRTGSSALVAGLSAVAARGATTYAPLQLVVGAVVGGVVYVAAQWCWGGDDVRSIADSVWAWTTRARPASA